MCRFQQTRVDTNTPSEEFTTSTIVISSWMRVRSKARVATVFHCFARNLLAIKTSESIPPNVQVDPGKSRAAILGVLEKLQKMAVARQREWSHEKIDQTIFKLYLSRILIQRSSM
jgi:hypothetical protein